MKKIKKLLSLVLAVLLMLCMSVSLVGCGKIDHNAIIIADGITYQEEWLDNNHVYGAYDENGEENYDENTPKSRTYLLKNQDELDEVFSEFSEIDFEKEMVLVYCYRTIYIRKQVLEKVVLDGTILNVEFNVVKGKMGHADASAPQRRMLVVKLDKLDITEVNITYNGQ